MNVWPICPPDGPGSASLLRYARAGYQLLVSSEPGIRGNTIGQRKSTVTVLPEIVDVARAKMLRDAGHGRVESRYHIHFSRPLSGFARNGTAKGFSD